MLVALSCVVYYHGAALSFGDLSIPGVGSTTKLRDCVVSMAENASLPVIDVVADFDAHPDPLSLFSARRRGHYNESGYALMAETVIRSLNLDTR